MLTPLFPPTSSPLGRHLHRAGTAAALLLVLAAWSGCQGSEEPGADLEPDVGPDRLNSAAVANMPYQPEEDAPAGAADRPETVHNEGVERGFADASGGHSLTGHTARNPGSGGGTQAAPGGPGAAGAGSAGAGAAGAAGDPGASGAEVASAERSQGDAWPSQEATQAANATQLQGDPTARAEENERGVATTPAERAERQAVGAGSRPPAAGEERAGAAGQEGQQVAENAHPEDLVERVRAALEQSGAVERAQVDLNQLEIRADADRVVLRGQVPSEEARRDIEEQVRHVQGVGSVENALQSDGSGAAE